MQFSDGWLIMMMMMIAYLSGGQHTIGSQSSLSDQSCKRAPLISSVERRRVLKSVLVIADVCVCVRHASRGVLNLYNAVKNSSHVLHCFLYVDNQ